MSSPIGLPSDGNDDQGWKLYVASTIMIIASGLFVIVRCAARIAKRQFGADDYTIVASLAFSIVLSVAVNLAVVHGYGRHVQSLTAEQRLLALKWFFIAQTPYKVAVVLYKISVLLFYKRIFIQRTFQITCWIVLGIIVSWGLAVIFSTIFQCVPISGAWTGPSDARCIDTDAFWLAYAITNILTDALVLSLPIPGIFKLNLNIRERILLLGVFMLGSFVIICGILRTTSVANSLANRQDITYNFIPRSIWTLIEANVGIICACLPILKSPFMRIMSRVFRTRDASGDASVKKSFGKNGESTSSKQSARQKQKSWPLLSNKSQDAMKQSAESIKMLNYAEEHEAAGLDEHGISGTSLHDVPKPLMRAHDHGFSSA